MKKTAIFLIAAVLMFCLAACGGKDSDSKDTDGATAAAASSEGLYADIIIRDFGTITVKLDPEAAPITVENFVNLSKSGFYDGLTFHRILEGYMMQGGDPSIIGDREEPEPIKGEFSANGWDNPNSHTPGAVSMARSNEVDSATSQFFIMQEDFSSRLDGKYAVFGYVVEGMDIVNKICNEVEPTGVNGFVPDEDQPVIETIVIREVTAD